MDPKKTAGDRPDPHGEFIAMKSFNDEEEVASGKDPLKVREEAIKKGCERPVVVYAPHPNERLYLHSSRIRTAA